MPRRKKLNPDLLRTRLSTGDRLRIRQIADARAVSEAQLVREMIIDYLHRVDQNDLERVGKDFTSKFDSVVNRLCSLLARIAIDSRAVFNLMGTMADEIDIQESRNAAIRDTQKKLERDHWTLVQLLRESAKIQTLIDATGSEQPTNNNQTIQQNSQASPIEAAENMLRQTLLPRRREVAQDEEQYDGIDAPVKPRTIYKRPDDTQGSS
jgi:hypothetical protein